MMYWNDWLGMFLFGLGCWMFGIKIGGKWQRDLDAHREWDEDIEVRDWKRARTCKGDAK